MFKVFWEDTVVLVWAWIGGWDVVGAGAFAGTLAGAYFAAVGAGAGF